MCIRDSTKSLEKDGVAVLTGHKAKQVVVENGEKVLVCEHNGAEVRIPFDEILVAVGRTANVTGFGPVSYTHLDVYKRQALNNALLKRPTLRFMVLKVQISKLNAARGQTTQRA